MVTDEGRKPATILEEWRSAERQLAAAAEGSPDYDALAARVLQLARAYRDASREVALTDPAVPPRARETPAQAGS